MPRNAPYTPRPGSLAERVISHLSAEGAPAYLTSADITGLFGGRQADVPAGLKSAVLNGALVAEKNHAAGNRVTYRLPADGEAITQPAATATRRATTRTNRTAKAEGAPLEALAAWADGDVSFTVPGEPLEGGAVVLTRAQLEQLIVFVTTPVRALFAASN